MTPSFDEIQNSATVTQLKECKRILNDLGNVPWDSHEVRDYMHRADVVVADVYERLTIVDPHLIPRSVLQSLQYRTQEILSALQSAESSGAAVHLNISNVNAQLDQFITEAAVLPIIPVSTEGEALEKAAEQFSRTATQAKKDIAKAIDDAKAQFEGITGQITEKGNEFDSVSAGHKSSFDARSADFEARMQELINRTNAATERIEREVTSIQETFRKSQGSRDEEFQQTRGSRDEEFHSRLDDTVAQVESFRDQARSVLRRLPGQARRCTIRTIGMHKERRPDRWRWIGIGALILTFLAAVGIFVDSRSLGGELSLVWALARTGVLAVSGASAAYILRQSGQHRRREEEMSRVANELLLLGPFLNRLEDTDRQVLLKEITPLYFRGGLPAQNPARASGRVRTVLKSSKGRSR